MKKKQSMQTNNRRVSRHSYSITLNFYLHKENQRGIIFNTKKGFPSKKKAKSVIVYIAIIAITDIAMATTPRTNSTPFE